MREYGFGTGLGKKFQQIVGIREIAELGRGWGQNVLCRYEWGWKTYNPMQASVSGLCGSVLSNEKIICFMLHFCGQYC